MKHHPDILYKYRSWENENHRKLLFFNDVYYADPKSFNDPFDYRVTPDFGLLDTEEKKMEYVNRNVIASFDILDQKGKNIEDIIKKFDNDFGDLDLLQNRYDSIINESLSFHGVFSCSELWDNILMWSHYGNNHMGFVIGFYTDELFGQSCPNGYIGSVLYSTDYPKLNPLDGNRIENFIQKCVTKSSYWAYEKEYRLGKVFFPNTPSDEQRTFRVNDNAIAEVIIGSEATQDTIEEIKSTCKIRNIPVFKAIRAKRKFELTRELI